MDPIADLSPLRAALLLAAPILLLLAAARAATAATPEAGWRAASAAALLALLASIGSLAWLAIGGPGLWRGPALFGDAGGLHFSLRGDFLTSVMLVLVSFIGWVIVGYSRSYLGGQRGQPRYVRSLMLTLAAVTLLVMTNNLLVLVLAWIGTSLALHALLTFFDERPQALIAAHKKFIASRVADLAMLWPTWRCSARSESSARSSARWRSTRPSRPRRRCRRCPARCRRRPCCS